ncbi:MAG: metallophosphoesterase, partial [Pseudomonadota bacterium]
MIKRIMLTASVFALMTGVALTEYKLTILHTNDIHSRIESINKFNSTCNAEDEAAGECFGGMARIKAAIDNMRAELTNQNVVVLDAGDPFQGSLFYTTYKGKAEAEFMKAIGYDAMAVGNHEFDDGPSALADFIDAVPFPVISGNLDLSGEPLLKDKVQNHVVLEVGDQKIGIISALATDTVETSSPGPGVLFQDEIESLAADVETLKSKGVNIVIALTHVGLPKDLEIAKAVPGIDVVIGGHSHTKMLNDGESQPYPTMVDGRPVAQAYAYSKYIGNLTVTFDDDGNVISASGDPLLLDASVTPDVPMTQRIAEMGAPIEALKKRV